MHDEGLTRGESHLDREIARALAVDPSPEFVARIRQRIATEPAPSPLSLRWARATTAAVAAAALAWIAIAYRPTTPAPIVPLAARPVSYIDPPMFVAAAPVGLQHLTPSSMASGFVHGLSERRAAPTPAAPEILIDPREARALRALLDGVREGPIDVTPLAAVAPTVGPDPQRDIDIAPIIIDPLTTAPSPEGVLQ